MGGWVDVGVGGWVGVEVGRCVGRCMGERCSLHMGLPLHIRRRIRRGESPIAEGFPDL